MDVGKILKANNLMTGTMTHNILLTREIGDKKVNLLEMESRGTRTVVAMRRKKREG